jgi:hypothetical protein
MTEEELEKSHRFEGVGICFELGRRVVSQLDSLTDRPAQDIPALRSRVWSTAYGAFETEARTRRLSECEAFSRVTKARLLMA